MVHRDREVGGACVFFFFSNPNDDVAGTRQEREFMF